MDRDREDSFKDDPFNHCQSLRLKLVNDFSLSKWGDLLDRYGELVDSREQGQVNNFSAGTLALITGLETDRSQWHTSQSYIPADQWLADLGIKTCAPEEFTGTRINAMIRNIEVAAPPVQVQPTNISPNKFSSGSIDTVSSNQSRCAEFVAKNKYNSVVPSKGYSPEMRPEPARFPTKQAAPSYQSVPEPKTSETAEVKNMFLTGNEELRRQRKQQGVQMTNEPVRKNLGPRRHGGFVPPFVKEVAAGSGGEQSLKRSRPSEETRFPGNAEDVDERLANIDPKMVELIRGEIMSECRTTWDDVAGLEYAKASIQEMVVWPLLRPDLFTGLRAPPRGLLLFGPPGTGKTLLGRCIAAHAKATFFCVSAATLTSKWVGDGEKMVRALFAVARCQQPAVVFIDEIDSILTQRSDTEHESSRRLKTEFLVQLDGAGVSGSERVLIVGATNRPQELDEAARRRLVKRLYIPLPDEPARRQLVARLLSGEKNCLSDSDLAEVAARTQGFSGADLRAACAEAALGPVRELGASMQSASPDQVRPVSLVDFSVALTRVKPSVAPDDLDAYVAWDKTFGCGS